MKVSLKSCCIAIARSTGSSISFPWERGRNGVRTESGSEPVATYPWFTIAITRPGRYRSRF
jgi:hypothetical protein